MINHFIDQNILSVVHITTSHVKTIVVLAADTQHTSDLNRIKNALFPNLPTFLGHLIASIILLFVIVRFFYTPFRQAQSRKHKYLSKVIAEANEKLMTAEIKKDKIYEEYNKTTNRCSSLISEAREKAASEKHTIITQAHAKSLRIIEQGDNLVEAERKKMRAKIRNQIIDNAFMIAEKIAKENLRTKANKTLINNFINDLNLETEAK